MTKIQALAKRIADEYIDGKTDSLMSLLVEKSACTECINNIPETEYFDRTGERKTTKCKMVLEAYTDTNTEHTRDCIQGIKDYYNKEEEDA